ncbi:MAG: GH92 family glycosyl hydrolase [Candidatus Solibacter sp.]
MACLVSGALSGAQTGDPDLVRYVNPFIGTGEGAPDYSMGSAAGNTPPGAAYPFGMALWSPDTTKKSGGYRFEHKSIQGFSLTHFSGRGISCWQDLPFMPVRGSIGAESGANAAAYASTFSHAGIDSAIDNETASPGFYGVKLDNGVQVDLTVTQRTGLGRFTFANSETGTLLVNSGGSAQGNWGNTWIRINGDSQLYGAVTSGNCGGAFSYTVFFVVQFDRPFTDSGTWNGDTITPGSQAAWGDQSGAYLTFDTGGNPVVQAKVGLSFVSFTNAYSNISAESPSWDFNAVRDKARAAWNVRLASIQVNGAADEDPSAWADRKTIFYSALYHASIHPSTFSDANGEYLGFDGKVHVTTRTQYHNIPSWDFYRSLVPLLSLTAPDVASDLAQSLVNDAQQDASGGMPRWVHAATDSCGMFGDGSPKVVATAYAFGARDFDAAGALAAAIRGAMNPGTTAAGCPVRDGLEDYLTLGYVSTSTWGSAARTLEYATSDFAIAQLAGALGDIESNRTFLRRAQNWRNLLHDGYIVPRSPDGIFQSDFRPDGCIGDGFIEGSGGQYSFMVRFNERGLFAAMGGSSAAVARLDRHFQQLNAGPCSEFAFMGNEVSLKTPWMYTYAGAPWKTQQLVRRILSGLYSNSPNGMPGNDDGGVLSSWVVFSSLGLYPQISGVGGFVVGSPVFPTAEIRLRDERTIRITSPGAADNKVYVQSLKVNGQEYGSAWIPWELLSSGGDLAFFLDRSPNQIWATQPESAPPSYDIQPPLL